jgi:hypothetical protein
LLGVAFFVKEVEAAVEELVRIKAIEVELFGLVLGAFFGEFGFELVFDLRGVGFLDALFGQNS